MIIIENTIVSDDVVERAFACNLQACKGACCVSGDSGAPLDYEETKILEDIYPLIKPYMTEKGIKAVEQFGKYMIDSEGEFVTPLVDGNKECAYTIFENGMALCGIEKACREGVITYYKPVSCHLYPVRIKKHKEYDAVNYDRWDICAPACTRGQKEGVRVFEFVKSALIRKYGEAWYQQLEGAARYKEEQEQERSA
jgi:hypothetical protein